VHEYYGPIARGSGRPPLPPMDLPPTFGDWRREVVYDAVMLPRLYLAFRSPVFGSDEYYAASVTGAILGMRRGSRLHRSLVRERQVAADATAFTFDLPKGSDLLVVDVTARPGIDAESLEREVVREVDALRADGVTEAEVERAVALIETDFVASMQAAGERADKLSMFATYFGNPALLNEQVDRYRGVHASDVNAFARARLGPDNRISLVYVPREDASETADVADLAATSA
jgi:predicted Zn-dependent peptidase